MEVEVEVEVEDEQETSSGGLGLDGAFGIWVLLAAFGAFMQITPDPSWGMWFYGSLTDLLPHWMSYGAQELNSFGYWVRLSSFAVILVLVLESLPNKNSYLRFLHGLSAIALIVLALFGAFQLLVNIIYLLTEYPVSRLIENGASSKHAIGIVVAIMYGLIAFIASRRDEGLFLNMDRGTFSILAFLIYASLFAVFMTFESTTNFVPKPDGENLGLGRAVLFTVDQMVRGAFFDVLEVHDLSLIDYLSDRFSYDIQSFRVDPRSIWLAVQVSGFRIFTSLLLIFGAQKLVQIHFIDRLKSVFA